MHTPVVLVLLLAGALLVSARPQQFQQQQLRPGIVPVLQRSEVRDDFGQVSLSYLSADGTAVSEHGALKQVTDGEHRGDYVLVKKGSYRYTNPEGRVVEVTYVADENGFQPQGEAIPVQVVA